MKTNARIVAVGFGMASVLLATVYKEMEIGARAAEPPASIDVAQATNTNASPAGTAPLPLERPGAKPTAATTTATNNNPAAITPDTLKLSPALAEVVRLLQAGVAEEVLLAYVTNSTEVFNIGTDEILYLHDLGAPPTVVASLIQRDSSPEMLARKQAAASSSPLPAGFALNKPAPNLFSTQSPVTPPQSAPPGALNATNAPPQTAATLPAPPIAYEPPVMEQPENVSYFYDELAPYGNWVEINGYGRCWRPTIAVWNSGWRPYGDGGHWLWSNCGWYWYSDYSWGWAPFHYGRWSCPDGIGWVWVPGTCWGPAWVSWRYSSAYCGWAPLPPSAHFVLGHGFFHHGVSVGVGFNWDLRDRDFLFVPTGRFCDARPSRFYLSASHANTVFKETSVVNNYVTVNKTTVVNHGVGFERIASATRGNIRQVALKGTTDVRNTNLRRETLDSDGKTLTIAQPPAVPATTAKPLLATTHLRPRTERITANAPGPAHEPTQGAHETPALRQVTHLESPDSIAARPTFVAPRLSGEPTRPTTSQATTQIQPKQDQARNSGTTATPATSGAKTSPPLTPGTRVQTPIIVRRTQPAPDNTVIPNVPKPNTGRPLPPARGEPGRNFNAPGAIHQPTGRPNDTAYPTRPSAPPPNVVSPPARSSIPLSPRAESYVAPAAPPSVHSAPPATHSAPPAHSSGGESRPSHSSGGSSGGDSGRRGNR